MKFHRTLGLWQTHCVIFIFISTNTTAALNAHCEMPVCNRTPCCWGEGPAPAGCASTAGRPAPSHATVGTRQLNAAKSIWWRQLYLPSMPSPHPTLSWSSSGLQAYLPSQELTGVPWAFWGNEVSCREAVERNISACSPQGVSAWPAGLQGWGDRGTCSRLQGRMGFQGTQKCRWMQISRSRFKLDSSEQEAQRSEHGWGGVNYSQTKGQHAFLPPHLFLLGFIMLQLHFGYLLQKHPHKRTADPSQQASAASLVCTNQLAACLGKYSDKVQPN